jgi:hypothetical protein
LLASDARLGVQGAVILPRRLQEPTQEIEVMFRRVAIDPNWRPETTISLISEYELNQSDRIA